MLRAFYLTTIAALALSIYISLWLTGVMILLVALSIAYSHPKTRLKDKPMGGLIANMLAHGGLVSLAGYPVYAGGVIDEKSIYLALYFYVTVGAIYLMTTIPDLEGDRATGKITMAVKQGPEKTITFAILLMILGIALGMQSEVSGLASLAGLSTGLFLWVRLDISPKVVLLSCKLPLLLLTFWAGAAYPVYLLFVIALLIVTRIYYKRRFNVVYPKLT
jgi:4-hydroxybenzoate polyprenyltransferase